MEAGVISEDGWVLDGEVRLSAQEAEAMLVARRLILAALQGDAVQIEAGTDVAPLLHALIEMAAVQQVQLGQVQGCEGKEETLKWAISSVRGAADAIELAMLTDGVIPPPPLPGQENG